MSDKFLIYLTARKSKILKQIQRLERGLEEIERTEKLYRKSGQASENKSDVQAQDQQAVSPKPIRRARLRLEQKDRGKSIKEWVCDILNDDPLGLTSHQILETLRESGLPNLERTSLSPQLSRLKDEGKIFLEGGVWKLSENAGAGSDHIASGSK